MEGKDQDEDPEPDGRTNQKIYRNERGKLGENTRKQQVEEQ